MPPILRLASLFLVFQTLEATAQFIIQDENEETQTKSHTLVLPYAFSTETLGFGVGLFGSYRPKSHPYSHYYSTAYITDNGSALFLVGGKNLQLPGFERLHIRPKFSLAYYTDLRVYMGGDAGSNESSSKNYFDAEALETILDLEFRYTLPWGHHRDNPVHIYTTKNGLLVDNPSGSISINPLKSGRSTLLLKPYYRQQFATYGTGELETLFFELGYEHDNRDFSPNPHKGYLINTSISHDPDWLDHSGQWTSFQGELNGYIPLWDTSWSRQQTLALSVWSAYAPSYDSLNNDGKPPYFAGPTLGGLQRMRAYPANRFHDKAAIYYSAEYRLMPEWQPLGKIGLLDPLKIRWWQIVGLVEVGRVAPEWNLDTLHSNMKYDFGVGLRGMFNHRIGRLDLVISDEGFTFVAMLGQSF